MHVGDAPSPLIARRDIHPGVAAGAMAFAAVAFT
jgi:hypothetical protein